jgi:hypothetical protein
MISIMNISFSLFSISVDLTSICSLLSSTSGKFNNSILPRKKEIDETYYKREINKDLLPLLAL